jgi:hypothetical protein
MTPASSASTAKRRARLTASSVGPPQRGERRRLDGEGRERGRRERSAGGVAELVWRGRRRGRVSGAGQAAAGVSDRIAMPSTRGVRDRVGIVRSALLGLRAGVRARLLARWHITRDTRGSGANRRCASARGRVDGHRSRQLDRVRVGRCTVIRRGTESRARRSVPRRPLGAKPSPPINSHTNQPPSAHQQPEREAKRVRPGSRCGGHPPTPRTNDPPTTRSSGTAPDCGGRSGDRGRIPRSAGRGPSSPMSLPNTAHREGPCPYPLRFPTRVVHN